MSCGGGSRPKDKVVLIANNVPIIQVILARFTFRRDVALARPRPVNKLTNQREEFDVNPEPVCGYIVAETFYCLWFRVIV